MHAPPLPPASPCHASSRRIAGCGNEPRRCLNFCHARRVYERSRERASSAAACSLRLPSLLHLPPLPLRVLLMCLYKRGRSSLERTPEDPLTLATKFLSTALLLRSSPSRLTACTAGRDSRPPKPHLLSPVREKGDKVFGERSARLLAASSRTIRSPTTTSPTTTSSLTSTTSSTTWQARTPTPSPALLLLMSRTCSCLSC